MALIKSVRGFTPEFGENCFLADNAAIIGDLLTTIGSRVAEDKALFTSE